MRPLEATLLAGQRGGLCLGHHLESLPPTKRIQKANQSIIHRRSGTICVTGVHSQAAGLHLSPHTTLQPFLLYPSTPARSSPSPRNSHPRHGAHTDLGTRSHVKPLLTLTLMEGRLHNETRRPHKHCTATPQQRY
ncbi:hypothetical protein E2C01_028124 [Portunus trituberculatus]|uniref:Uncharacterized protein n=1 Tax=Portunus trituberculatus TaxID=210409 RepID=A0A5B7EQS0_PORTR|nr:hypothetical protein [Portunus trituberculatus]